MASNQVRAPQRALPPRRRIYTSGNQFDFDETKIPPGMKYQWIATHVAGMETRNAIIAEQNGWTVVPADRHPELAGLRATKEQSIDIGGQRLYEIPIEYYQEEKDMNDFAARNAVESQIARLGLAARRDGVRQPFKRDMAPVSGEEIE